MERTGGNWGKGGLNKRVFYHCTKRTDWIYAIQINFLSPICDINTIHAIQLSQLNDRAVLMNASYSNGNDEQFKRDILFS